MKNSKAFQRPITTQEGSAWLKSYLMQSTNKAHHLCLLIITHCLPSDLSRSARAMMRSLRDYSLIFYDLQVSSSLNCMTNYSTESSLRISVHLLKSSNTSWSSKDSSQVFRVKKVDGSSSSSIRRPSLWFQSLGWTMIQTWTKRLVSWWRWSL